MKLVTSMLGVLILGVMLVAVLGCDSAVMASESAPPPVQEEHQDCQCDCKCNCDAPEGPEVIYYGSICPKQDQDKKAFDKSRGSFWKSGKQYVACQFKQPKACKP